MQTYRFEAIAADGAVVRGQLEADDETSARARLRAMNLTPRSLDLSAPPPLPRAAPLNATDFAAFNEQLAQLARAGLPVERGLRLVAQDLSRGRLRDAVDAVSRELDGGATLPDAIDRHRVAFPPLYANVVDAGIRVGNLPAVLFNLGRHLELSQRLRQSLTRALAYPTALLLALVCVAAFLSAYVLPLLTTYYIRPDGSVQQPFDWTWAWHRDRPAPTVPWITLAAIAFGRVALPIAIATTALVAAVAIAWPLLRGTRVGTWVRDSVVVRLPLVGPAVRFGLVGRWCDAVRIGVDAGLDLPAALALGGDAIGSGPLSRDTAAIVDAVARGGSIGEARPLAVLPATVPATLDLAVRSRQLHGALATLAELYLRQSAARARAIPLALTPILLALIACVMGAMIASIFLPIVRLLNAITGTP